MNLKDLINLKGNPKIFFDSYKNNTSSFFIYDIEEEIILNSKGCFLNGIKMNEDPLELLQKCITKWKLSSDKIACIGFLSYNFKKYLFPHINFKTKKDDVPYFWFAKPKKVFFLKENISDHTHSKIYEFYKKEKFSYYKKNIEKIKSKLNSGDVYQVNYTYPKKFKTQDDINNIYFSLRNIAKPQYGWFIDLDYLQILSFSPERLFKVKNGYIFSNPIKGTMPRSKDIKLDNKYKNQLKKSAKDQAENLMITDLIRNDLGKICKYGSIEVNELFKVVSFETVHHMVSKISGKLKLNINELDVIKALFPGGSITGAPKESAMKIIDKLENYSRELYTGSIGYVESDGTMDFNIAIRTIINNNDCLKYSVGGGIVWDSIAENEWEETKIKTKILNSIIQQ